MSLNATGASYMGRSNDSDVMLECCAGVVGGTAIAAGVVGGIAVAAGVVGTATPVMFLGGTSSRRVASSSPHCCACAAGSPFLWEAVAPSAHKLEFAIPSNTLVHASLTNPACSLKGGPEVGSTTLKRVVATTVGRSSVHGSAGTQGL